MANEPHRTLSFWLDSLEESLDARPALAGEREADVAIVGAGYSGLWTAYYLRALRPELRVALVEAEIAGFGASGRNGGWATGHLSGLEALLADPARRDAGLALQRAVFDAVDEIGRVAAREGIDCHYRKGGSVHFATNEAQRAALQAAAEAWGGWGFGPEVCRWLGPEEVRAFVRPARCLGGFFEAECASLDPARLVRGLARAVEEAGATLFEGSRVRELGPGRVVTDGGRVRAKVVVRATEGYTARLPGAARDLLPLHSWMLATEPLPARAWEAIGLAAGETFGDARRMTTYGQRTRDGRLAFGARGTYEYGSKVRDRFPPDHPHFRQMERQLVDLFPALEGVRFTHRWGGPMGVPRDWLPRVGLDRQQGVGWIGGYVGQGVAAANLAGRTLAELIAGQATERTGLAWVAPPARRWEPEPLRWLAVANVARAGERADRAEAAGRRAPLSGAVFRWLTGRA